MGTFCVCSDGLLPSVRVSSSVKSRGSVIDGIRVNQRVYLPGKLRLHIFLVLHDQQQMRVSSTLCTEDLPATAEIYPFTSRFQLFFQV